MQCIQLDERTLKRLKTVLRHNSGDKSVWITQFTIFYEWTKTYLHIIIKYVYKMWKCHLKAHEDNRENKIIAGWWKNWNRNRVMSVCLPQNDIKMTFYCPSEMAARHKLHINSPDVIHIGNEMSPLRGVTFTASSINSKNSLVIIMLHCIQHIEHMDKFPNRIKFDVAIKVSTFNILPWNWHLFTRICS